MGPEFSNDKLGKITQTEEFTHTEKVGKNQLLLSCQITPLFWHRKFHKPGM
jgi:hypothetical protein